MFNKLKRLVADFFTVCLVCESQVKKISICHWKQRWLPDDVSKHQHQFHVDFSNSASVHKQVMSSRTEGSQTNIILSNFAATLVTLTFADALETSKHGANIGKTHQTHLRSNQCEGFFFFPNHVCYRKNTISYNEISFFASTFLLFLPQCWWNPGAATFGKHPAYWSQK